MNTCWKNVKTEPPRNGEYVAVLVQNGSNKKDWYVDIACFCNDDFYKLTYDPHLDVLRKTYYDEKIEYWTGLVYPSYD